MLLLQLKLALRAPKREAGAYSSQELELLLDTLKKPVVEPSHGEQGRAESSNILPRG